MQLTSAPNAFHVLLIHGLNLKPLKMHSLKAELQKLGMNVENVELSGHRPDTDWSQVTRQEWLSEIKTAYDSIKTKAEQNPIFLVAYSLGALLAVDLVSQDQNVRFDRAVLLSPALAIHDFAFFLRLLSFWPRLRIPSLTPKEYRFNNGTSIAAYMALFESLKAIEQADLSAANVPTAILIDPKDELVSFRKLRNLIEKKKLSRWKLITVSNQQSTLKKKFHHLTIDSAALGETQWQSVLATIQSHLQERKSS